MNLILISLCHIWLVYQKYQQIVISLYEHSYNNIFNNYYTKISI